MPRRVFHTQTLEPRLEMTPLLDIIFLLLTFFIYSLVVMVQAQVLPVTLPALGAAREIDEIGIVGITVDQHNKLFFNQEPMSLDQLTQKLKELAGRDPQPAVYLAMEDQAAGVDRGPTLIHIIDQLRQAGITNFYIVGQPKTTAPEWPPE